MSTDSSDRPAVTPELIATWGREVVGSEARALENLRARVGPPFVEAVELIRTSIEAGGKVVVTGIGKSGLVGRRIAASLTSLGSTAVFLHPVEAVHGDVGLLRNGDVGLALSQSGQTAELLQFCPMFQRLAIPFIALTGNSQSALAQTADVILDTQVESEACAFGLAPTTSCAVQAALGDALAVAISRLRGLTAEDFAYSHPGGMLGRRLILKVRDVMHSGDRMPCVSIDARVAEAILEIINMRLGMTVVVDSDGQLAGILTDGDLKRILVRHRDIMDLAVRDVMMHDPRTIEPDAPVTRALSRMEADPKNLITCLLIVDEQNRPQGVIHLHDCLQAGVA